MKKRSLQIFIVILVVGAVAAIYFMQRQSDQSARPPSADQSQPAVDPSAPPPPRYPIPESASGADATEAAKKPLPGLLESDLSFGEELAKLLGNAVFQALIQPRDLIRHITVTIDGLRGRVLPPLFSPIRPPEGTLVVASTDPTVETEIAPANNARYKAYVDAFSSLDVKAVTAVYIRFYPLFQEAYRELGMREYFNDRVVDTIDHLLSAPQPNGPLRVRRDDPVYEFADERLEGLSAGQKLMVRVGSENETRIKAKLRELRDALTNGAR